MVDIIRFSGSTCGPCRMQKPLWIKLQNDFSNNPNIRFSEIVIDIEEDEEKRKLCSRLNLKMVPSIVAFDEQGNVLETIVGFQPYKDLCNFVTRNTYVKNSQS